MTNTIPADASIVVDTQRNAETWCVYEHQAVLTPNEPPETIMIGACRLTHVYLMQDGKTNSEWNNIFANGGHVLVRIVATAPTRADAFRAAADRIRALPQPPRCNMLGYSLRTKRQAVVCINNGKTYETQQDAAMELGIHASAISRHLRGHSNGAGGYRFAYAQAREGEV